MFIGSEALDLRLTLADSAQCFHWQEQQDGSFMGVLGHTALRLWREQDGIHACGDISVPALRHYLDLDRDYAALAQEYANIPMARHAMELYPGLRVLNQQPWPTLVSFILSANNNVSRIRGLVAALCRELGPQYELEGQPLYGFPTPATLMECREERLRALRVGYRAPYLTGSAAAVVKGFPLDELCNMEYDEAHRLLTTLPGVGNKVADCVLLFGCGHSCAFPVDVWVERLLVNWFGMDCGGNRKKLGKLARERLGEHAGILQQFLFHAARMGMDAEIMRD